MTSSKFQELLDGPTAVVMATSNSRPPSAHRQDSANPMTISTNPGIQGDSALAIPPAPSRNSSTRSIRKLQRKSSSGRPATNVPTVFSGPDADFDFGHRQQIQRIEGPPESPTEQTKEKNHVIAEGTRKRLRKLTLTTK